MKHSQRKHAKFSASGSSKWVNCAGSVQAEVGYKNKSSSAAKEGTAAHELADVCFKDKTAPHSKIGETYEDNVVDEEMAADRCTRMDVDAGHPRQRDDRRGHRAERDRCRVGQQ